LLVQKEGRWRPVKDSPLEMNIPEGLRDVIGKRLSLLSKECNQLLSVASVIGREFTMETLKAVGNLNEDVFVTALKEAVRLAVLEERSQVGAVRYRFTHAFFRQTLYEEMIAPERLKLHRDVAVALEMQYSERLEEHASELAEHFSQSTDPASLKKAVAYSELAAKRALAVYAYGEAVRLLNQALKVQKVLNPDDRVKQCDLLLALAEALLEVPDTRRVLESEAPAAFALAESLGDDSRAARACVTAVWANLAEQGLSSFTPEMSRWVERLGLYAPADTPERALANGLLGSVKYVAGDNAAGQRLLVQALELARRLRDPDTLGVAASAYLLFRSAPQHTAERLQLVKELFLTKSKLKGSFSIQVIRVMGEVFLGSGQRAQAEEAFAELRALAVRTSNVVVWIQSAGMDAVLAVMDGRLRDALVLTESLRARGKEAGMVGYAGAITDHPEYRTRIYLGESLEAIERVIPRGNSFSLPLLCLVQAYLGRKPEVSEILEKSVVKRPGIGTVEDETRGWVDTLYLESAVLIGHRPAAELLLNRLSGTGLYTTDAHFPTCIIRHLGGAAALLSRYDEARQHYQEAIRVCTEMPFRPELALSRLQMAELLLEHYPDEKKDALEHLDFAIQEFREMKMQPSLERALRQKQILKA
jgi:tetratricopeptide (TPR) repeat protein